MGKALAMVASVALWPLLALTRWWLADLPVPDWRDMPEEPPCPHCGYFGGEEHHPSCVVLEKRRLLARLHAIRRMGVRHG